MFDKPDHELSENELRLKKSIVKRRLRQNRSYHRRKERERKKKEEERLRLREEAPKTTGNADEKKANTTAIDRRIKPQNTNTPSIPGFDFQPLKLDDHHYQNHQNHQQQHPVSAPPATTTMSTSHLFQNHPFLNNNAHGHTSKDVNDVAAAFESEKHVMPTTAPSPVTSGPTATMTTESSTPGCLSLSAPSLPAASFSPLSMAPSAGPQSHAPVCSGALSTGMSISGIIESLPISIPGLNLGSFGGASTNFHEDHDEEEENRVISSSLSMTDTLDHVTTLTKNVNDQTELVRMTGLKKIVFNNLRDKYDTLPLTVRRILRHLSIFPRTFDLKAASAVAGLGDGSVMIQIAKSALDKLMEGNFVVCIGERWELNEVAKMFLTEDVVSGCDESENIVVEAKDRYVQFYADTMKRVSEDDIHKIGWARERAMALYDVERDNMEYSQFLSACKSDDHLREFLTAGISVMRYCVKAKSRIQLIRDALTKESDSANKSTDMSICGESPVGTPSTSVDMFDATAVTTPEVMLTANAKSKARLELALGEAYFDTLNLEEAEEPLVRAMSLMWDQEKNLSDGIVSTDAVLATLLLANLRMRAHRWQEARALLIRALKILQQRGLGKTTYAINAMSNLVGVYVAREEFQKAKILSTQLLDCLTGMGYENMPIMADSRGQTGLVCMSLGEYQEAEQQFAAALEIVASWNAKKWFNVPIQHCIELDLWLMEGWARAIYMQGRKPEAEDMMQRADQDRVARGLRDDKIFFGATTSYESPNRWSVSEKAHIRHVY